MLNEDSVVDFELVEVKELEKGFQITVKAESADKMTEAQAAYLIGLRLLDVVSEIAEESEDE